MSGFLHKPLPLNSSNGPHSTLSLQAMSPNLTFLLQTSNLVPKRGSRWFLTSSTTHCHMSVFTALLAHFPIFGLFSLIRSTFLDPKLMDDHKLLALYHFRSRSGLFLIQGSQNTKKDKVSGNTTDLSTSHFTSF